MLVLSRKKNETIVINGNITITVVQIRGDKVRIGIEAPEEMSVHREEIQQQINAGVPERRRVKEVVGPFLPKKAV
jgi:carbon storage regulator